MQTLTDEGLNICETSSQTLKTSQAKSSNPEVVKKE
jgi:hypothetical protein